MSEAYPLGAIEMPERPHNRAAIVGLLIISLLSVSPATAQQGAASLQITSPADDAAVTPGQTIPVVVTASAGSTFRAVVVVGEDPIGFSDVATGTGPFQFNVAVPGDISVGPYHLIAVGGAGSGVEIYSAPITIAVDRPDQPTRLGASPTTITFEAQGQQISIHVIATFSDGSVTDVTNSSKINYSAADTGVAQIDPSGIVTAIAAGTTAVTAMYGQAASSPRVSVPITVRRSVLTPSPAVVNFGDQSIGQASPPRSLTIQNTGAGPLRITALSTTGDFAETDDCIVLSLRFLLVAPARRR